MAKTKAKSGRNALGGGVDALLQQAIDEVSGSGNNILHVDPKKLLPNPEQPRKDFDEQALYELADSIKEYGIIQPIIVEKTADDTMIIIAGERRTRAACLLELETVPVIVSSLETRTRAELALIENIQREDLNSIEEAEAFRTIMDLRNYNQDELAEKIGKSRSAVANTLRLLKLPENIQDAVRAGDISAGHARALLSVVNPADQQVLFKQIIFEKLTVREAESKATHYNTSEHLPEQQTAKSKSKSVKNEDIYELRRLEQTLIEALGTKVQIKGSFEKGYIEISYFSKENLDELFNRLRFSK